jgi:hypothetical protein
MGLIFFLSAFFSLNFLPSVFALSYTWDYESTNDRYHLDWGIEANYEARLYASQQDYDAGASPLWSQDYTNGAATGAYQECNGFWTFVVKDTSGNVLLSGSKTLTQIQSPASGCPNLSSGGSDDELKQVINQVRDAVNSNGQKLDDILRSINTDIDIITPSEPQEPSLSIPKVEDNKPAENPVYTDNTQYFADAGDSNEVIPNMPIVPDVEDWPGFSQEPQGTQEQEMSKDSEMTKDSELQRDSQMSKDGEMTKDSELQRDSQMSKDGEMTKDSELQRDSQMSKDGEMTKDSELQRDSLNQDIEMSKDDEMQKDSQYVKDGELVQDGWFTKTMQFIQTNFFE